MSRSLYVTMQDKSYVVKQSTKLYIQKPWLLTQDRVDPSYLLYHL